MCKFHNLKHKKTYSAPENFIKKALNWANQFTYCCVFNNNKVLKYPHSPFANLIGVSNKPPIAIGTTDNFASLNNELKKGKWLIGHLSYDLKNQIEQLESKHHATIEFPLMQFFTPEHLIHIENNTIVIESDFDPDIIFKQIVNADLDDCIEISIGAYYSETTRQQYISTVEKLLQHIIEGDIYEINYCIEFVIDHLQINPVQFYLELCELSPTPFSTFYKIGNKYALGASPERFLKKEKNRLISQPIKGTAKRGNNLVEDEALKNALLNDEKERAENMMIVDLVRNDLAKSAVSGTVKVNEMFGIYSFKHWHQMISTVTAEASATASISTILKNAFPMGSMTGAPKIKVMQLIERYESFKRGLYAGAIGYISPNGDFDFNVVIRTLFYDRDKNKASFMVGSAITSDAIPEKEYDECLLKIKPILKSLEQHASKPSYDFSIKDN